MKTLVGLGCNEVRGGIVVSCWGVDILSSYQTIAYLLRQRLSLDHHAGKGGKIALTRLGREGKGVGERMSGMERRFSGRQDDVAK